MSENIKYIVNENVKNISEYSIDCKEKMDDLFEKVKHLINDYTELLSINKNDVSIYSIGDYLYYTNIGNVIPYKAILEVVSDRKKIISRIKYKKLASKKKISAKDLMIKNSLENEVKNSLLNSEIAENLVSYIKNHNNNLDLKVTSRQNCILIKIDDEFDFVIIVSYRFNENLNTMVTKYKGKNIEIDTSLYFENFNDKVFATNEKYLEVIQMLKYIEVQLFANDKISSVAYDKLNIYENLFCNVPNELFNDSCYDSIVNSLNYLYNCNLKDLVSVDNQKLVTNEIEEKEYKYIIKSIIENFKNIQLLDEFNIEE